MSTNESNAIPPEILAELQQAADQAARGAFDLEEATKAAADMDKIREANRQKFGEQNIGVDIIRAMRESR
jgi:hypothetical protein